MAASGDHHHGFHGPKCWVLSAIIGAVLGYLLTFALPAQTAHTDHHGADHPPTIVVQSNPDGSAVVRLLDESTVPIPGTFDYTAPADIAKAEALIAAQSLPPADPSAGTPAGDPGHAPTDDTHAHAPNIPLILCAPFAILLLSIALMPFISERFWHAHFPDFAFLLGSLILTYYLVEFGDFGKHALLHVGLEYYAFIALVGGLYVVSGGILVDIRDRGRPVSNTALLAIGAVLANLVGTTGASVLLIRPFLRMNQGRLRPLHVVFFIFIVSNCGGCLTPIGDPPLYLGFLKGVPFFWTLTNLWPMWLAVNTTLLVMFFIFDSFIPKAGPGFEGEPRKFDPEHRTPLIVGFPAVGFLIALVACVFVDPLLGRFVDLHGLPVGATLQIVLAVAAYFTARPSIRNANHFTFAPVKEVGFLFIGIFLTMAPALEYLRVNASTIGLESPTQFYFGTGILSGFLDNAPTYLSFLQVAFGVLHLPLNPAGILEFINSTYDVIHPAHAGAPAEVLHFNGVKLLEAISLAAVFFGAMTYIGNGPNFMVKSIVDSSYRRTTGGEQLGVRMPSFFGYMLYAVIILFPVLIANWLIFIR